RRRGRRCQRRRRAVRGAVRDATVGGGAPDREGPRQNDPRLATHPAPPICTRVSLYSYSKAAGPAAAHRGTSESEAPMPMGAAVATAPPAGADVEKLSRQGMYEFYTPLNLHGAFDRTR